MKFIEECVMCTQTCFGQKKFTNELKVHLALQGRDEKTVYAMEIHSLEKKVPSTAVSK